jgi:hypothetical protein
MKNLIYWTGLRITRDRKILVLLLLFFVFFASFSLIYRQQNITTPHLEMREEYQDELQIYRMIPQKHFEGELGQEVQQRLGNNSVALSVQSYWLSREEEGTANQLMLIPDYTETGKQLVENNLFLYNATEFGSYDLLVERYLPPLEEVHEQARFFESLDVSGLEVEWNYFSAAQVLKAEMELIAGILIFLFIALLASDHFTKDHENHWSVTHGLPVPWKTKWRVRSVYLFSLFWGTTLFGLLISYFIGTLVDTRGSLFYPTAIYFESGIRYIPLWQYLGIILLLAMLLSYILILLTTGLSWFIRNSYLTILLIAGLFVLPRVWSYIPPLSSWQPSVYLDLMGVIDGSLAQSLGLNGVVWWKAGIVYLLVIILLEIIFQFVFSKIPTETTGLKRRVLT